MLSEFATTWADACSEAAPDPEGAAGRLMSLLARHLQVEQVQYHRLDGAAVFLFDLAPLGLPGMDVNPMMITHAPTSQEEAARFTHELDTLHQSNRSAGYCFHIVLEDISPSEESLQASERVVVAVFESDLKRIFSAPKPQPILYEIIRRQIPLTSLCPYNTQHGARGSMFFDREKELRVLESDLKNSYVVSGARRIGKSSLLRRAYDGLRMRRGLENRVFLFDCRNWGDWQDCCRRVMLSVEPRDSRRAAVTPMNFVNKLRYAALRRKEPLILFFDEMDRVVETDAASAWTFANQLAELTEAGSVRLVCAGYRAVSTLAESSDSPFHKKIAELQLPPFSHSISNDMLRVPLKCFDIGFSNNEALDEIWKATGGYPFMIQYFGERIFGMASENNLRLINSDHVRAISDTSATVHFIYSHFLENTIVNDVPQDKERQCAILLAQQVATTRDPETSWSDQDFYVQCQRVNRPLKVDEIHKAVRNLCNAAILTQQDGRYRFAFPLIPAVLAKKFPNLSLFLTSLKRS